MTICPAYLELYDSLAIHLETNGNDHLKIIVILTAADLPSSLCLNYSEFPNSYLLCQLSVRINLFDKIDSLTANLDKMYMDRLTGLLAEADFERIYQRVKMGRTSLEEKLKELESQKESPVSTEDRARELVQQFLDSAYTSRELLVSLIERVELTENKQIIIKFRFRELEAIS